MRVQVTVLENGTRVKIKNPGPGERGTWVINGIAGKLLGEDQAYGVTHEQTGRQRIFRRSRMRILRGAQS